jgi:hypothetical protein
MSSRCNAILSISATVGEETEVEVALVLRLCAGALRTELRADMEVSGIRSLLSFETAIVTLGRGCYGRVVLWRKG